ncbi:NINE protein [Bartonella sp. B1098]|uniref:NINE protein n=1 Tax=Bartonella sp. B1098 TaxID=2911421 RepID=UPI0020C37F4D|nr:NINE protein [Bartonella sp. B1098]
MVREKTPKVGDIVGFVYEGNVVKSVLPLSNRKTLEQSRLALAILCFCFGAFGSHRFVADKLGTWLAMLLITTLTMGFGALLITIP